MLQPSPPPAPHPAGISKNWSVLYVWLQYVQWYKILCWLMVLLLGGSEGLLPSSVREAFRVEELLLASDMRAQVFIFGQFAPFVLAKMRHFLVTWAGSTTLVRFIFYSAFTSHVEVAATLACDAAVAVRAALPASTLSAPASLRAIQSASHAHAMVRVRNRACAQGHLLYDWAWSASSDYRLRLNLNRLRSGYFAIASRHPRPRAASGHAHAD